MRSALVLAVLISVSSCASTTEQVVGSRCSDEDLAQRINSISPLKRLQFARALERCGDVLRGAQLPRTMLAAVHHSSDFYLEKLIEKDVSLDVDLGQYYSRPMMQAIRGLDTSKVKLLIEGGAEVDYEADVSWGSNNPASKARTPLRGAQMLNRYDIVYALIQAGADYNRKDVYGKTLPDHFPSTRMRTSGPLYRYFLKVIILVEEREGIRLNTSEFRTYVNKERVPPDGDIAPK
ncbi:MAG: ankyrin repeat domain-containing protein [Alcanivoracaceae bacterium]|jgi:hypothetical protein|nr:ankyrin repeat domain-containing protein [Alcanivoracaceae bacterium]